MSFNNQSLSLNMSGYSLRTGNIRNVTVYPIIYRGNYLGASDVDYDVYYRVSTVDEVAAVLNIDTAEKSTGRLVSEIAYRQYRNPSMKTGDGIIEGLKKLEDMLCHSDVSGNVQFRIVVTWERLEEHNHWLWETYSEWVKKIKESEPYDNGIQTYYRINDPYDIRKIQEDIQRTMIAFPQTINFDSN